MLPARRETLILGAVGLTAAAAGALIGVFALQSSSGAAELLAAPFRDLSGKTRRLIEWQGRVLVCNFWATWCAPCREEIPLLIAAQRQYDHKHLRIVGIGIDSAAKIAEFSKQLGINYPLLIAESSGVEAMKRLGNKAGGLPYTVIFDRGGSIALRKLGAFSGPELEGILAKLLR